MLRRIREVPIDETSCGSRLGGAVADDQAAMGGAEVDPIRIKGDDQAASLHRLEVNRGGRHQHAMVLAKAPYAVGLPHQVFEVDRRPVAVDAGVAVSWPM